jgi:RNA polymerase sigma-70 factor (ECF subfamily)
MALLSLTRPKAPPMFEDSRVHEEAGAWSTFEREALPHSDRLFRMAMWLERNRADAEDAVQETMVQALRSFHRYEPGTNCRAWLLTILHRVISNRRRARGRSILVSDPDDLIAQTVPFVPPIPQELTDELVLSSLRQLPHVFQEIILLCDVEDLSYKEAAEVLDIPPGTVMSRLHRGRARLRAELAAAEAASTLRPEPLKEIKRAAEKVEVS